MIFSKSQFDDFIADHKLAPLGGNYKCVAVIGCQSSGKSTLLNIVFGTSFEMMDEDKGRQ